ncbi:hypothetical protein B8281_05535 [Cellulosimicrobium sp. TH-20]|uniref:restriction endonuclease n=1 Tax=Cellulosimicrobium sp. TH-20 TaxID=1980001 RepID=UPI000A17DF84|nr:restriction endonuclease [Cellulosimicrobium sp. TH-20]ARK04282.1 hypothetical protein B8281_05535 [Cellulosimicrobium sp. TH-20]
MAVIRSFRRELKGHATRHPTEVDCLWFDFLDEGGGRVLQLATLGSDQRQSKPKVSQTIQLSADASRELARIIGRLFGPTGGDAIGAGEGEGLRVGGDVLQRAVTLARLDDTGLRAEGIGWSQTLAADTRPLLHEVWLVRHVRGTVSADEVQAFGNAVEGSGAQRGMLVAPAFTRTAEERAAVHDLWLISEEDITRAENRSYDEEGAS